jgi:mannose/fructose-specific phosphotransferase system component IIA
VLRGLIVTHGDLGRSLRATAETMTGLGEDVEVISNEKHSRDSLCDAVETCLAGWGEDEGIVLTDIPGGSCTHAALLRAGHHPNVGVVTGVNLPMLVDFLFNRSKFTAREMAERLEFKGKTAVRNLEKEAHPSASASGDEGREPV